MTATSPFYLKALPHPLPLIVSFNLVVFQNSFRILAHASYVHISNIYDASFSQFLHAFSLTLTSLTLFTSIAVIPCHRPESPTLKSYSKISFSRIVIPVIPILLVLISYNVSFLVTQRSFNLSFFPNLQICCDITWANLCQYSQSPCSMLHSASNSLSTDLPFLLLYQSCLKALF